MTKGPTRRVLLVGWDSADWQIIEPMLSAGLMPTLNSIVNTGVIGNLATLKPVLSPILWNSIATGKRAEKHGILGFIEPRADGAGVQAVSSTSRKTKAIWNILTQSGLRSNVVGWYASHPAEPINGVCVSEHFARVEGPQDRPQAMPPNTIHPARVAETLNEMRLHAGEIGAMHLAPFVPNLGGIPREQTPPIGGLQKMLARAASTHAAITHLLEHEPWDFAAVYYEAIDHVCHGFMQYHPPKMPHIADELFERYKGVVTGIYRFHDMMLQRLVDLAGDDATIMIVSDHGFLNDHLRPVETPQNPIGPEGWHRHHGIFAVRGPGIRADERIYGATILDITPTILTLMGLPIGQDMDGKVLVQCFGTHPDIQRTESWDKIPGEAGLHPADMQVDPFEQQAALKQLVELGYIQDPGDDQKKAVELATTEASYNLAAVHLDAGRVLRAASILEQLRKDHPQESRFAMQLAHCYLVLNRLAEARNLVQSFPEAAMNGPQLDLIMGTIEFAEGNAQAALDRLERAERAEPRLPNLHIQIGTVYQRQRRWEDAERAFKKALAIDGDAAMAHFGLGISAMYQHREHEAIEHFLCAVGLMHYFPRAHFMLGVSLTRLGWYDRAIKAFEVALSLRPAMPIAHRYLAALYSKMNNPEKSIMHRQKAQELIEAARATVTAS
jgi:tetratricopeptide (TPR) repeat protein